MTTDTTIEPPSGEKKLQMYADNLSNDDKHLRKSRLLPSISSLLYPILLALLLIIATTLLVVVVTRRNTCRQLRDERLESALGFLPKDHTETWVACVKTQHSSACACPASYVRSSQNPSHCIPSHSRCLQTCHTNAHCACYHAKDALRCLEATRRWLEKELKIGAIEFVDHRLSGKASFSYPWTDHRTHHLEKMLVDTTSGQRLFFSADRRTGITIDEREDDYLLNERWTKIETNTTRQQIAYTQLDPQEYICRMLTVNEDGSTAHGIIHTCPGAHLGAPYFFGVACHDVLALWHGDKLSNFKRHDGLALSRHHFEPAVPSLPVLLDPFHRYYSLYNDSMIEIKDLNGDILGQLFTGIEQATKFDFIDHHGTILIANQTHMQRFTSTNQEAWLDI